MPQATVDRACAALLAPRSMRIERQVRAALLTAHASPAEVSTALLKRVHDLGLQPFTPPTPLAPIQEEDIALVCWLASA